MLLCKRPRLKKLDQHILNMNEQKSITCLVIQEYGKMI